MKRRVLILCTGNSCRSQMAEGLWRGLAGDEWDVHSAGSHPAGYVYPLAIRVMREFNIDIAGHRSKHVSEYLGQSFDVVLTVCDFARDSCPVLPGSKVLIHWPIADPVLSTGSDAERMMAFRHTRDEIAAKIQEWLRADKAP